MCSSSVEPMPSTMSRSKQACQRRRTSGASGSAALDAEAHGAQVERRRVRQVDHRAVQRRHREEQRRPVRRRGLQQPARVGLARPQHRGRADRVREREVVAQPVGVVELGRAERDVALGDAKDLARVGVDRVRDVVVQVHDALGEAGRAAAEEPEGHVVGVRVRRRGVGRAHPPSAPRTASDRSRPAAGARAARPRPRPRARRSRSRSGGSSPWCRGTRPARVRRRCASRPGTAPGRSACRRGSSARGPRGRRRARAGRRRHGRRSRAAARTWSPPPRSEWRPCRRDQPPTAGRRASRSSSR